MNITKRQRCVLRIQEAKIQGEMLLDGQRIEFDAIIDYPRIDAAFELADRDTSGRELDQWAALQALEAFVDEQLRGKGQ
jgi:hypothetical protein